MRILWLCRWFGNYRIPVYKELNRLTNGNFYMAYSRDAVTPLVNEQMKEALEHETTLYLAEWHQRLYLETCLNQERTAWLAQQEQYQREQAELLDARKCLEQENEQLRQSVRDLQEKLCFAAENALQR